MSSTSAIAIPKSRQELAEQYGEHLAYFPATWEEYWDILEHTDLRADYHDHQIIAMSYEPDYHSELSTELSHLLKEIFPRKNRTYKIHNANRPIYVEEHGSVFNPDGSVVLQPPIYFEYRPGMNAETTPFLLFEVLSPSTRKHDLAVKLPSYKSIPSLKYIVYIELKEVKVSLFVRENENTWRETIYSKKKQTIYQLKEKR